MKPMSLLESKLTEIIANQSNNLTLKRILVEDYLKNGLSSSKINQLFNGEVYINLLSDTEKLILLRSINKTIQVDAESEYFTESFIYKVDHRVINTEQPIKQITLDNMQMVNTNEFVGIVSYKQIYDYISNGLLIYDITTQRAGSFIKLGDTYAKIPSINIKAVNEMVELIKQSKLYASNVTLSHALIPDIEDEIDVVKLNNGMYRITGDYLNITDGMHRILSITKAYSEELLEHRQLQGNLIVKLMIAPKQTLRELVSQSFMTTSTEQDFIKTMEDNNLNNFTDSFIDRSEVLKNNVGKSYDEFKYLNMTTTYNTITKAIEYLEVDYDNKLNQAFIPKEWATRYDVLVELLKRDGFYLDYYNLHFIYLIVAYKNKDNNLDVIEKLELKLAEISDGKKSELKLGNKQWEESKLLEYFGSVI